MERRALRRLLKDVAAGRATPDEAAERIRRTSIEELDFATLDLERARRRGFPEVVYGPGKSTPQIVEIARRIHGAGQTVLVTRVGEEVHAAVREVLPGAEFHAAARAVVARHGRRRAGRPGILVVSAGTADIPVAEEAALTAELMGNRVRRIHDVGVAGLHRLLSHAASLVEAKVIVVVAGMEGALPSVVAGLTDCPVIGVPTDAGYGTSDGGRVALMAMLNSCVAGLTVVNVGNGFGAGYAAGLVNRRRGRGSAPL